MEPDLSHSISMHPHLFQTASNANSSSSLRHYPTSSRSPAPQLQLSATSSSTIKMGKTGPNASSTGVEAMTPEDDAATIPRHTSMAPTDVEAESQMAGRLPMGTSNDPYGLQGAYKSAWELEAIKANTSRKRHATQASQPPIATDVEGSRPSSADRTKRLASLISKFGHSGAQARRLKGFYEAQNETIERLLKSVEEHRAAARQEQGDDQLKFKMAVWGSLAANIFLSILQVYGAVSSGSLSLFTTMADAIFDPLSNLTLIGTDRAVRRVDPSRFPSGKARLETVGNIAFCFIMTSVSLILIVFSIRDLAESYGYETVKTFHLPSVIAVCVAFGTKLVLFLYTWSIKDRYSQIAILWQDHRNDLFINGFGILTSVGGSKLVWWLDPAGAIVLSLLVSCLWLRTAFTEFLLLVGVVASVEMQQLITYVCVTHDPAIRQIDTVRVYHSGPRLIAEVDIVMDRNSTLMATHDVAEELQFKLESLPDVERAYVHVDYETTHKPEHAYKKDL